MARFCVDAPECLAVLWEAVAQYRENTTEAVESTAEAVESNAALVRKLRTAEALEAQLDALFSA